MAFTVPGTLVSAPLWFSVGVAATLGFQRWRRNRNRLKELEEQHGDDVEE